MEWIQTTTGRCRPDELGMTLVHEHLLCGFPGWQMDALAPRFERAEALSRSVAQLQELRVLGVATFVDPCPMDLGRDVEFMAEVSQRSGVRIICTTGAYKEGEGIAYTFGALPVEEITEIYVKELVDGIGATGIRAGLIKVATGAPEISAYEKKLLTAAGRAAAGAPHSRGPLLWPRRSRLPPQTRGSRRLRGLRSLRNRAADPRCRAHQERALDDRGGLHTFALPVT